MNVPLILSCVTIVALSGATFADDKTEKKTPAKPETAISAPTAAIKDVSVQEAEDLLKKRKDVVVLDVRTPDEFAEGHIAGAQNVDAQGDAFAEKIAGLDKSKTYLLHCAAGGRSSRVLKKMRELNFQSIYHMNGGMNAWEEAGKPVQK